MAPAVITVTTSADAFYPDVGSVSLRQAIAAINAGNDLGDRDITAQAPGVFGTNDTIKFDIPGAGVHTITLGANLPRIAVPMTIDGYSQPGASVNTLANGDDANIMIEVDVSRQPGLVVSGSSTTIQGLAIFNAVGAGIELDADHNVIAGNFIGLRADGTTVAANSTDGVLIPGSSFNRIGGATLAERNVISGNLDSGIAIGQFDLTFRPTGNLVQGNFIGTDATGTLKRGNQLGVFSGLFANSQQTTVGGTTAGSGNLISGNSQTGVVSEGFQNILEGNLIGTDISGTLPLGNGGLGVELATPAALDDLIGGTTGTAANTIAFNGAAGIGIVFFARLDAIRGNAIFANGGLGIDVGNDGVTPNDPGDADNVFNDSQNFPVLASAVSSGGGTTITGAINTNANTALAIDFYANAAADPSGFGQGQTYLGSTEVVTDGAGNATFSASVPVSVPIGQFISSTATTIASAPYGDTSEFSQDIQVAGINNQTFAVNEHSANGTVVGTVAASDPNAGQTPTYAILSGNTAGAFFINPSTGQITVTNSSALDFETTSTFSLIVQVTDNGSPPLSSSATITINLNQVNQPPVNNVPGAQTLLRNSRLTFSSAKGNAISISDEDAGTSLLQVTLAVSHGRLTLGTVSGLTFTTGDGVKDATMTFTGTLSAINTALNGLKYRPHPGFVGSDSLTIITDDLGTTLTDTDMVSILVTKKK